MFNSTKPHYLGQDAKEGLGNQTGQWPEPTMDGDCAERSYPVRRGADSCRSVPARSESKRRVGGVAAGVACSPSAAVTCRQQITNFVTGRRALSQSAPRVVALAPRAPGRRRVKCAEAGKPTQPTPPPAMTLSLGPALLPSDARSRDP